MESVHLVSAAADVCATGCQGVWFESDKVEKFDHESKGIGAVLQQLLQAEPDLTWAARDPRVCPRCAEALDPVPYPHKEQVTVDLCMGCGGLFLDAGELADIRERELSPEEVARSLQLRRRIGIRRKARDHVRKHQEKVDRLMRRHPFQHYFWGM